MVIDEYLEKNGNGWELESQGLLKRIRMGNWDVITAQSPELYIGTTALADCASLGVIDTSNRLAGVLHTKFTSRDPEHWFEQFGIEAEHLINLAHENGANILRLAFINVRTGYRRAEVNSQLGDYAEQWAVHRKASIGDVDSISWYNAEAYYIDKISGLILPF